MLEQKDDRGDKKVWTKSSDQRRVNSWLADMLEASRDLCENTDGIIALRVYLLVTEVDVEVGAECKDDDHECVSRDRQEEEQASLRGVALR
jgi:hypothetical protein